MDPKKIIVFYMPIVVEVFLNGNAVFTDEGLVSLPKKPYDFNKRNKSYIEIC